MQFIFRCLLTGAFNAVGNMMKCDEDQGFQYILLIQTTIRLARKCNGSWAEIL